MEFRDEIRRGAALLDKNEPGWRDRISPAELAMEDCARCVIGQVCGLENLEELEAEGQFEKVTDAWGLSFGGVREHGFATHYEDYHLLRDAWIGFLKGEWS